MSDSAAPDLLPVSVVILAWNAAEDLPLCLTEVAASRGVDVEIIVVDNASADDSAAVAEAHPAKPRVLQLAENRGCAGGNNAGWRAATHPYVVFLNPDCYVDSQCLAELVRPLAQNAAVGATGAKLLYPNTRTIQHAGGILFPNAMAGHRGAGEEDRGQWDEAAECDYVTGACVAARRADLEALGGVDEEYFPAYYEETDLCARLIRSGKRVLYVGGAVAWHRESVGVGGRTSPRLVALQYRGRMRYLVKNTGLRWLLTQAGPFEWRWMRGPHAQGFRLRVVRSWLFGAVFALRCCARLSRRPSGVRSRLPAE